MIRVAGIVAVLALVAISAVNAIAGSRSRQAAAEPRSLGHGVYLCITGVHVEPARDTGGLIETHITLSNYGATPLKIDYLTFSLSGAAGERSLALLPSELNELVTSPLSLREGLLPRGGLATRISTSALLRTTRAQLISESISRPQTARSFRVRFCHWS